MLPCELPKFTGRIPWTPVRVDCTIRPCCGDPARSLLHGNQELCFADFPLEVLRRTLSSLFARSHYLARSLLQGTPYIYHLARSLLQGTPGFAASYRSLPSHLHNSPRHSQAGGLQKASCKTPCGATVGAPRNDPNKREDAEREPRLLCYATNPLPQLLSCFTPRGAPAPGSLRFWLLYGLSAVGSRED